MTPKRIAKNTIVSLATLLLCSTTWAQELTDREKKLLDIIESLEKRVSALEEKFGAREAPADASVKTPSPEPAASSPASASRRT